MTSASMASCPLRYSPLTYGLHLEALTTLMVMLGHAMYVSPAGSSAIVRTILDGAWYAIVSALVNIAEIPMQASLPTIKQQFLGCLVSGLRAGKVIHHP